MQFEDQGRDKAATISSSVRIHYVFNLRKIDGSEYLSVVSGMQLSLAYHFIMMGCRLGLGKLVPWSRESVHAHLRDHEYLLPTFLWL